jgi:hypothetical protein
VKQHGAILAGKAVRAAGSMDARARTGSAAALGTAAADRAEPQGLPLLLPHDCTQLSAAQAGVTTGCLLITEIAAPRMPTPSTIQAATTNREPDMFRPRPRSVSAILATR